MLDSTNSYIEDGIHHHYYSNRKEEYHNNNISSRKEYRKKDETEYKVKLFNGETVFMTRNEFMAYQLALSQLAEEDSERKSKSRSRSRVINEKSEEDGQVNLSKKEEKKSEKERSPLYIEEKLLLEIPPPEFPKKRGVEIEGSIPSHPSEMIDQSLQTDFLDHINPMIQDKVDQDDTIGTISDGRVVKKDNDQDKIEDIVDDDVNSSNEGVEVKIDPEEEKEKLERKKK